MGGWCGGGGGGVNKQRLFDSTFFLKKDTRIGRSLLGSKCGGECTVSHATCFTKQVRFNTNKYMSNLCVFFVLLNYAV